MLGEAGTVIRAAGCGPFTAVARAGFALSAAASFISSESSGATKRNASTSFSKRVNSISFCRKTSYTFFILRAPARKVDSVNLSWHFSRVACVVKGFGTAWRHGLRDSNGVSQLRCAASVGRLTHSKIKPYGRFSCPRHFFSSHSTHSARPGETGNPQASHFRNARNIGGTWL